MFLLLFLLFIIIYLLLLFFSDCSLFIIILDKNRSVFVQPLSGACVLNVIAAHRGSFCIRLSNIHISPILTLYQFL